MHLGILFSTLLLCVNLQAIANDLVDQSKPSSFSVYVEVDYGLFQHFGKVSAVQKYVESVFDQVASIYHREELILRISEIKVLTSCGSGANPCYSSTTPNSALNKFKRTRPSFNGDIACLLVKTSTSGKGEALAYQKPSLCLNQSSNAPYTVNLIDPTFSLFPDYSRTVMIVAHEIGHILSGPSHTGPSECGIMSLCDLTSPLENFYSGFTYERGEIIRNTVANAFCQLDECTTPYSNISITSNVNDGTVENKIATNTIQVKNRIYAGAVANYSAGRNLVFQKGFKAHKGSSVHAFLSNCDKRHSAKKAIAKRNVTDRENDSSNYSQTIVIHPNPVAEKITILNNDFATGQTYDIVVFDLKGRLTFREENVTSKSSVIDINDWEIGLYFGRVYQGDRISMFKIIKNQ